MKKIVFFCGLLLVCNFVFSQQKPAPFAPINTPAETQKLVNFLVSTSSRDRLGVTHQGAVYKATTLKLAGKLLPLSYYSTPAYWGEYICKKEYPGANCQVTDDYNEPTFTPKGPFGEVKGGQFFPKGADLQVERVNVYSGSNIYDASTWQIALALASLHKLQLNLKPGEAQENPSFAHLVENQNLLLKEGYDGNAIIDNKGAAKPGENRAITKDSLFKYNKKSVTTPNQAFHFRMIPKRWQAEDPFIRNQEYLDAYIKKPTITKSSTGTIPSHFPPGTISWLDWKPITGENAWAFYLGSLQAEWLLAQGAKKPVQFNAVSVQNALDLLDTFSYMQSKVGAIFYVPSGSLGNTGSAPVKAGDVSVENNASALAGFHVFEKILEQMQSDPLLNAKAKARVNNAICRLDTLIYGGQTADGRPTNGLLSFFKKEAWDGTIFVQGGYADQSGKDWTRKSLADDPYKAVDVTTWGIAAIGPKNIDAWHGFGTAYKAWDDVKKWGSFSPDGHLWGVGYTDAGNAQKNLVMSAEWTAGAINMVRMLIRHYDAVRSDPVSSDKMKIDASNFLLTLKQDEQSMSKNLLHLRTDKYPKEAVFDKVRPANWSQYLSMDNSLLAYVYANKRYFIPFGWFANPLPSTTSVAWPIMLDYNFNPFSWEGGYNSNEFKPPEKARSTCGAINETLKVQAKPAVANALGIAISICTKENCRLEDWTKILEFDNISSGKPLVIPANAPSKEMEIPSETKTLSVSFKPADAPTKWFGACRLALTPDRINKFKAGAIFVANWNDNGNGDCGIQQ